jgi:hypothetical protein
MHLYGALDAKQLLAAGKHAAFPSPKAAQAKKAKGLV